MLPDPSPFPAVTAALIARDGKLLVTRRPPHASAPLHWEFPGGKAEPGETLEAALARELMEELDLPASVGALFLKVSAREERCRIDLYAFFCRAPGEPTLREHVEARWVAPGELSGLLMTCADRAVAQALASAGGVPGP